MKQQISTPAAIGLIALVLVVVLVIGFKVLGKHGGQGSQMPPNAKADYEKRLQNMHHFEGLNTNNPPGGAGANMGSPGLGSQGSMGSPGLGGQGSTGQR